MNTINDKFSIRRLGTVMKLDIMADRMLYLVLFVCMVFLMTYQQVAHFDSHNHLIHLSEGDMEWVVKNLRLEMFSSSLMVLLAYIGVMTASICNPTRKKETAINYLMIPSTCAEKFVSRVLIIVLGTLSMTLLVWLLSDLMRMAIVAALPRYANVPAECNVFTFNSTLQALSNVFFTRSIGGPDHVLYPLVCNYAMVAFYVYSHSLMLLGACIFRNFFAGFAPFFIFVYLVFLIGDGLDNMMAQYPVLLLLVFTILIVLNWWLSYYYFSHKMIVRRPGYIIKKKEAAV